MSALVMARSCFSFGYGVEEPETLVAALPPDAAGMVLADSDGLHGQSVFQAAAAGIRAGSGVRMTAGGAAVILLALEGGWSELSRAVSARSFGTAPEEAFSGGTGRLAALVFRPGDAHGLRRAGFEGRMIGAVLPPGFGTLPAEAEAAFAAVKMSTAACWPVVFTREESIRAHRLARSASVGSAEASLPGRAFASPRALMPGPGQIGEAFRDAPASRRGAIALAGSLGIFRPSERLLMTGDDGGSAGELSSAAHEAFRRIYGRGSAAARRLETELESIIKAGLAGYFLAFREVAAFCSREGITATARGSAAGSMVSYLLGISGVCPIRCGLSFSRFFNTLRPDPPDIDLDIDSLERERVVSFVLDRWGGRAACVGETVRHRRNAAFRAAAGAAGLGPSDIDSMSVLLDDPDAAVWKREPGRRLLDDAALLEGLPSHLAPHPCGLVISPAPVPDVVPLWPGTSGQAVTQFDMDGVERAGLLKMDLLGQRGLSAISLAGRWLGAPRMIGGGLPAVPGLSGDLSGALALMAGGRTIGVAHVESPAMRGLLHGMRVSSLDDVARALALVRPGASGNGTRDRFFAALRGESRVDWAFDELRDILGGNLGELLYEEDVSECAARLIGIGDGEADLVRRRLRKGRLGVGDIEGFGVEHGRAVRIHSFLSRFAGYGFCRAHAYSYAAVACVSASLKASAPAEFMASVLAGGGGFYDLRTYVEEARRLGLRIFTPGINTGEWLARPARGGVMLGFSSLKGMGPSEFASLLRGRPYSAPSEVAAAGVGRQMVKAMALAGCFEEIGLSRPGALWSMNSHPGGLFTRADTGLPEIPEHCESERVSQELRLFGAALSANPLHLVERPAGTAGLDAAPTGPAMVWGRAASRRSLSAGAGFLMLEDDLGYADVFLPSPLYSLARLIARRDGATLVMRVIPGRDGRLRASSVSAGPLTPCAMVV